MKKALFICMPFARPSFGSLALGLLKSVCREAGLASEIRYLNVEFAKALGECRYLRMSEVHDGEICFTPTLFPDLRAEETWRQYCELGRDRIPPADSAEYRDLRRSFLDLAVVEVPAFLDRAFADIPWSEFDVVGFSVGFNQTIASLALANRIRRGHPETIIIFGGATCDGDTGPALLEYFEALDVVVSGPSDHLIVPLIEALRRGEAVDRWPNVYCRASRRISTSRPDAGSGRGARAGKGPPAIPAPRDLDWLPLPDYDEYFAAIADYDHSEPIMIPYESSRGCWWGEKHQCTFCGLNGSTIAFRSKAASHVLQEIRAQYERHGISDFYACDCILDMEFFDTLLPGLATLHDAHGITTFYELKSNLRSKQIRQLRQSGVTRIQPGIESFSDHVLALMNKGTSGLNQVRMLRDCAAAALEVRYGVLWGNPGETAEDYRRMTELVPSIRHLPPPHYVTPMTLQRFSPYFSAPEAYDLENLQPAGIYRVMYGHRPFDYDRLAYIMTFDHGMDRDEALRSAWREFFDAVAEWRKSYEPLLLASTRMDDTLYVADRRNSKPQVIRASAHQMAILGACATGRTRRGLERTLNGTAPRQVRDELRCLCDRKLILPWQGGRRTTYLSLPVPVPLMTFERILSLPAGQVREAGGRGEGALAHQHDLQHG